MSDTAELIHDERLTEADQKALAAGDSRCWERTYRRIHGPLYGYCLRLSGNETAAFDLTQETFARAMSRCRERGTPDGLKAYLFTTARNLYIDSTTRKSASDTSMDAHDGWDFEGDSAREGTQPEVSALVEEQRSDVHAALLELPDRQRQALAMCDMEGCSYGDAGKALGLEENAVAQLVFRARGKLRLALRLRQIDESKLPDECKGNVESISRMLDGQLKGDALINLEKHLVECDACLNVREEFGLVQRRYRALAPLPLLSQDDCWANLVARKDTKDLLVASGSRWGRRQSIMAGVGCVLLVAIFATGILQDNGQEVETLSAKSEKSEEETDTVTTAKEPAQASKSGGKKSSKSSDEKKSEDNSDEDSTTTDADEDADTGDKNPPPPAASSPPPAASSPPPAVSPTPPPAPGPANLIITNVTYNGGSTSVTIYNSGESTAGASTVRVSIGNGSWTAGVGSIGSGSSSSVNVSTSCYEGNFVVNAYADYYGAVSESSESDNSGSDNASMIC